jgi:uncharacterized membrane protein
VAIAQKRITRLFRISIVLKGLHALLEIVGGTLLYVIHPDTIQRFISRLTQNELLEDRQDLIANTLRQAAHHLSIGGKTFAAFYLLSHGVIKLFLVIELLRKRLWAYPASLAMFAAFIAYQLYRYTHTHSIGLIVLTVFDLAVMWLIWREYRIVRQQTSAE